MREWLKKKAQEAREYREAEATHKKKVKEALTEARRKKELSLARKGIRPKGTLEKLGEAFGDFGGSPQRRGRKKRKKRKSKKSFDPFEGLI